MSPIGRRNILELYKSLMRYSEKLQYTDKNFYQNRVRQEFNKNRTLNSQSDVEYFYNVCLYLFFIIIVSNIMFFFYTERTRISFTETSSLKIT